MLMDVNDKQTICRTLGVGDLDDAPQVSMAEFPGKLCIAAESRRQYGALSFNLASGDLEYLTIDRKGGEQRLTVVDPRGIATLLRQAWNDRTGGVGSMIETPASAESARDIQRMAKILRPIAERYGLGEAMRKSGPK